MSEATPLTNVANWSIDDSVVANLQVDHDLNTIIFSVSHDMLPDAWEKVSCMGEIGFICKELKGSETVRVFSLRKAHNWNNAWRDFQKTASHWLSGLTMQSLS